MSKSSHVAAVEDLAHFRTGQMSGDEWIRLHAERLIAESASSSVQIETMNGFLRANSAILADATNLVVRLTVALTEVRRQDAELARGDGRAPMTLFRWRLLVRFHTAIMMAISGLNAGQATIAPPADPIALLGRVVDLMEKSGADASAIKRIRDDAQTKIAALQAAVDKKEVN